MSEVLQTVLDYVKSPQTDYALLITGPWGCGKTYFWKNVIEHELKGLQGSDHIQRILYVSLYGVSDVKDIDRSLFTQSYPGINRKGVGRTSRLVAGVVEALGYVDLAKINLRSLIKAKDAVICFDDLERTRLPMEEVLGYINTFVEHEGAKTIILCNEEAIGDDKRKIYNSMKEKVVGFSHGLKSDYNQVLESLVNEHKRNDKLYEFLTSQKTLIGQLFFKSETHNIRTLRRVIAMLSTIFTVLKDGEVDPDSVAKQIIYALETAACEFHSGRANAETLRGIHSLNLIAFAGLALSGLKEEKTYEREFSERYFSEAGWHQAVSCPPICEFLLTGFLDRVKLLKWARELTQPLDEKSERMKRLTTNPRGMEDSEFEQTTSQVLQELEAGEIEDVSTYISLYDLFELFANNGLIAITPQHVLEKFIVGLEKIQETGKLKPKQHLKLEITHPIMQPRTSEGNTFRQRVLEANEKALGLGLCERIKALDLLLRDDPHAFITTLVNSEESGFLLTPVFQELDAVDIAKRILALSNSLKSYFGMAIRERYLKHGLPSEFIIELPALTVIKDQIKSHCEERVKGIKVIPMSLFITQGIVKELEQAVEQLEQLKQKENGNKQ